jgi:hypothetical protein
MPRLLRWSITYQPTHTIHMLTFDSPEVFSVALKFVRRRCPHLNEEELQDAAQNWINYMKVVWRINEREDRAREARRERG